VSIEKLKIENHQELEDMLTKEMNQIEKDLTMICNHIPINDKATLDVLCHDENGQLVIVQMNVDEDDTMLLHGIQSLDYVDKFKSFLKATYNKQKIDDKQKPRLILIAPSFSDAVRSAVEGMKGLRIDLYEWEYLQLGDQKGLRLQSIFSLPPPMKEKPAEKKHEQKPVKNKDPEPEPMEEKPAPQPTMETPQKEPEEAFASKSEEEQPKRKLKLF